MFQPAIRQAGTSQELNEAFHRYFAGRAVAVRHDAGAQ